jgi:site-specific recombinase XerC
LVTFYRRLPPARQPSLWQDVTRLTPADIDAWLEAAQRHGLAPSTIHTTLSVVRRFCTFLQEHGLLAHHPIQPRRHAVLLPQLLPRPMAEEDLIRFFQVIDVLRDRTMFLLMLRCQTPPTHPFHHWSLQPTGFFWIKLPPGVWRIL